MTSNLHDFILGSPLKDLEGMLPNPAVQKLQTPVKPSPNPAPNKKLKLPEATPAFVEPTPEKAGKDPYMLISPPNPRRLSFADETALLTQRDPTSDDLEAEAPEDADVSAVS